MGKYGSGLTFGQICKLERQEIEQALNHKVLVGEDSNGSRIYEPAEKSETDKVVLDASDEVVYQAMQALASGRALERLFREQCKTEPDLKRYMELVAEENTKYQDYFPDPSRNFTVIDGGKGAAGKSDREEKERKR